MKTFILTVLCFVCSALPASPHLVYSFPGGKFGKGPGLTVKGKKIDFAPVSRMYIREKFDPAGGVFEITSLFRPVPLAGGKRYMHYFWSARDRKQTVASAVITENAGQYNLSFYVYDSRKKPVSCTCRIKLPAKKSIKFSFFWTQTAIGVKINNILFAKKNYKGQLLPGESFIIGTGTKERDLIPMTLESVKLYRAK